jgi:hypothetical protein
MPNPRLARLTLYDWIDLPEEKTPVKRTSLQSLETRLAEFIFTAEAGIRHAVKEAPELETLPGYKEAENEAGDVAYAEKEQQFFAWNATGKVWVLIPAPHWRAPVGKAGELPEEGNELGDVRVDEETFQFYVWHGTEWKIFKPVEAEKHTHTTETLTWSVAEKLTEEPIIPGGFRRVNAESEEECEFYEVESVLGHGKAELEIKVNGTAVKFEGGSTKLKVTTEAKAKALEPKVRLGAHDKIELIVSSATEAEGLALSAFVEHIAKAV